MKINKKILSFLEIEPILPILQLQHAYIIV
jgi:hypothetical protein